MTRGYLVRVRPTATVPNASPPASQRHLAPITCQVPHDETAAQERSPFLRTLHHLNVLRIFHPALRAIPQLCVHPTPTPALSLPFPSSQTSKAAASPPTFATASMRRVSRASVEL
ncbi:hypothetical protein RJ55_04158 [Drechmeria coniospora]|nr:hypothetical protein RJ55_04158 [Drechmeria coniospora]